MNMRQTLQNYGCSCDAVPGARALISLEDALAQITRTVDPVQGAETVPLHAAHGRVLAHPVLARDDMPRFDHAAMDGYAVCVSDLKGDGPWTLPVIGRVAAGDRPDTLDGHQSGAHQVFTGAPVPPGRDCVVMQEHVLRSGNQIVLSHRPNPIENIRLRGEEYAASDPLVPAGMRITPRTVAVATAGGHGTVSVVRKLRVVLLVSGSEIAVPGAGQMDQSQIWDVNTPMLSACLSRPDIDLVQIDTMPDQRRAIAAALADAARRADLVITTGGVSVGEEDHLHAALSDIDGQTIFSGVAIKPGKPITFGRMGTSLWLGLPGNPQSAFVTWTLFGETILQRLAGCSNPQNARRPVLLGHNLARKPGRSEIRPACLVGHDGTGRAVVTCQSGVHSGQMGALSRADGLVFLPADAAQLAQGALVEFLPLTCQ